MIMIVLNVFLLFLISGALGILQGLSPHPFSDDEKWTCVPIKLDFCQDIPYNRTIFMSDNFRNIYTGKASQDDSKMELSQYDLLVKTKCSKYLKIFLCGVFVPICDEKFNYNNEGIPVCGSLCEEVRSKCISKVRIAGYDWPDKFNCSKFPVENNKNTPCLDGGITPKGISTTKQLKTTRQPSRSTDVMKPSEHTSKITSPETYCKILYSKNTQSYIFVKRIQACALECMKDGLFTFEQKQITEKWMTALTFICGFLCLIALVTVFFNYQDTCYPERSIVFITLCYFFYCMAYGIRLAYSREGVTCQEENGRQFLLVDGAGNISCAATFLLTYCFFMIQNVWWVILCLSWFLSAGMKWTPEAIRKKSFIFHIVAWGIPCCKTVVILVWRKIDVNELTGICSVGNRFENLLVLQSLVLAPLFTYLVMGTVFLVSGIVSLFWLPSSRQEQLLSRKKLKQLLLPVGAYGTVHTLLSTIILASYFYEYVNKNSWYHDPSSSGPEFSIFIIRVISDYSIGIIAAIWLIFIHGPKMYSRLKMKFYNTEFLLPKTSSGQVYSVKSQTDTTETSI